MPVPDYQTLMLPVLRTLADGKTSVAECLPLLKQQFAITDEEAEELIPSGRISVLASRAHWARTYLSKAGLLTSPSRNVHVVTERGRALLAQNPTAIDNATLEAFEEFAEWRTASQTQEKGGIEPASTQTPTSNATPDDQIAALFRDLTEALEAEVLEATRAVSPAKFERIVVDLLTAMGFGGGAEDMAEVLGKSGDGGIDGVVREDALGLDAVYVQAKRYDEGNTVGRPDIQRFVGSLTGESATKGVFVTTSRFSSQALDYVSRVSQRIVLIDGARLAKLMILHDVGVRAERTYIRKYLDDAYFDVS